MATRINAPVYDLRVPPDYFRAAQETAESLGLDLESYVRASLLDDSNADALLAWARQCIRDARINVICGKSA